MQSRICSHKRQATLGGCPAEGTCGMVTSAEGIMPKAEMALRILRPATASNHNVMAHWIFDMVLNV